MSAEANPQKTPSPRRLFAIAFIAALLTLILTLSFGYADHAPQPHGVRIAVAAPPAVDAKLAAALHAKDPGAFTLVDVADARAATHSVRSQRTAGALIVGDGPTDTIVTAGAEGLSQQQVITKVLTAASAQMHRAVTAQDVSPLQSGDTTGLSSFVFGLGLLVPSVIGSILLFLLGARFRLWWRVAAAALYALLAALAAVLVMDTILGALTGSSLELIGVGFVGALSFVLVIAALQSLIGLAGSGVSALIFVFVGNAISGGSVPVAFLPGGFRQVAPWLPNNAIIRSARDVIYYNGHDIGHSMLVLAIWPLAGLVVLGIVDVLHLMERRLDPERAAEIYRTSAVQHIKNRRARRVVGAGAAVPTVDLTIAQAVAAIADNAEAIRQNAALIGGQASTIADSARVIDARVVEGGHAGVNGAGEADQR